MVKNIPAIERSTEIRFGKHVPDSTDQADNTIVFNASNVLVPTPYSNACYLSPIRNRTDYLAPEVVLLMYDRNTKEITESGESANVLVGGSTLNTVVDRSNATSNTMLFIGQQNDVAFVTSSNVGISNMLPQHTLSIGSNLYVDDVGSNVLTVSGNVSLLGNLHVSGSTTLLVTENTSIKDALFELGRDNTSTDTTLDLGLLMHRPSSSSNVVIGYREGLDEFAISYTESNPNEKVFIPKTDEDINVHVYGLTHVDANIYAHEDLHVSGNTHVTGTGTSTIPSLNVYRATSSTSRTTGALIVGGGLGVGGDIHATHANLEDVEADSVNITDTTASSSKTTGALRVAGGLGVAGDIHATHANLEDVEADSVNITDTTAATSKTTGALRVAGGLGVAGDIHATHANLEDVEADSVNITDTTASNSKTTGALKVAGGLGVAGDIYGANVDADSVNITDTTASSSKTTGALKVAGGLGVAGDIHATHANLEDVEADSVNITDTTASSSKTTGALKVAGGLGVAGDIYGANVDADSVNITDTTASSSKTTGALKVAGGLGVAGDIHATHANLEDVEADSVNITDTTASSSKTTGALKVAGGLGVAGDIHATHANLEDVEADSVNITDATASSSKTTGALRVAGGLGVAGDIHATHANLEDVEADSINITDTTASSSKTTGALKVAGGAGIQGDLYAADTTLDSVKALNLATGTLPFTDSTKKLVDSLITQNDDGSIIISANVEIAGNVSVVGNTFALTSNDVVITDRIFDIANNNTSTSLDIGILMEHPGKNIFIGHHTNPQDNFTIGYTSNGYTEDHVEWNGTDHITANVWGYLITQNTVTIEHNDLYVKNGLIGVTTESPVANIHVVGNAFVTSNITTSSNIIVGGTATATSKTTGALQVSGGLGVAGDIHATHANLEDVEADSVNITDTTASTSKTTGALKVAGGLGVAGDIHGSSLYTDDYLIHSGDTDTKIGFPLADTFTVTTANTERLRVNATGATLSTDTSGSAANPELSLYRDQTGSNGNYLGQIRFDGKHDGGNNQLYAKITGKIKKADQGGEDGAIETAIITDGSQRISLRHTGDLFHIKKGTDFQVGETANIYVKTSTSRVGINTDSPAYSLDVQGTSNVGVFTSTDGTITNATASTSKTTGALKVAGGLGVAGDIYTTSVYAGHDTDQASYFGRGAIGFSGDTNHASFSHIDNNTSANYAIKQTEGGTTHLNTKSGQHIRFNVNNSEKMRLTGAGDLKVGSNILYVDVSESAIGVNTDSPAYSLDVQGTSNVGVFTSTGGTITDTTASSSKTTGALKVAGGLGVAGDIHATHANLEDVEADSVNITDTTASSSKTTGALKVAGGLGVAGALYGGAATFDDLTVDGTTLTVDTSNDRVGVKTGSPAYTLDINGDLNFAGSLYQGGSAFVSTPWTMETSPTALSYTAGNVGIGAANPQYKLEVDGDINIKSGHNLRIAGNIPVFSNWTVSGSDIYRSSGNVGIGTNSPLGKLDVRGAIIAPVVAYASNQDAPYLVAGTPGYNGDPGNTGNWNLHGFQHRIKTDSGGTPRITVDAGSGGEVFTIRNGGNVGIGTTNPNTMVCIDGGTGVSSGGGVLGIRQKGNTMDDGITLTSSHSNSTRMYKDASGHFHLYNTGGGQFTLQNGNGNVGIATASPSAPLHVHGGTIINSDGVAKKTYSYSGDLTSGQTVANSTIKITFSAHVFYAKIVAHLVESDNEVSTFSLECGGGNWSGGTPLAIAKGPQAIFGSASTNPWSSTVTTSATTVSFKPTTNMAVAGHYNVFIEYISQHSSGVVSKITEGATDVVTFGY